MPRPTPPPPPSQNPAQEQPDVTAAAMRSAATAARTANEGRDLQYVLYAITEAAEVGATELIYHPLEAAVTTHLSTRGFTCTLRTDGMLSITW